MAFLIGNLPAPPGLPWRCAQGRTSGHLTPFKNRSPTVFTVGLRLFE